MKYLASFLVLCALLSMSDGSCYIKPITPGVTFCKDDVDDTWHPFGSSWRNSQCMDCDCGECCTGFSIPRSFPDDCVSVFNQKTCEYIVHKRNDPSIRCEIFSAVGK